MKIDKNIPIPPSNLHGGGGTSKSALAIDILETFEIMENGDSVYIDSSSREDKTRIQCAFHSAARLLQVKITTRCDEKGVRCWLLQKEQ